MGLNNLSDDQLKEFAKDPKKFLTNEKNMKQIIGIDSSTRRRIADILKYDEGLSKEEVKNRINKLASEYYGVTVTYRF